jgi:hypothetical protein
LNIWQQRARLRRKREHELRAERVLKYVILVPIAAVAVALLVGFAVLW